jgi:hypothetical protein
MGLVRPATTGLWIVAKPGSWGHVLGEISKAFDVDIIMIDSSSVRTHQHGRRKKGTWTIHRTFALGGLTTKENTRSCGCQRPSHRSKLKAEQTHDNQMAGLLLAL